MRHDSPKNVVITGAPSSGKSTLFDALKIPAINGRVKEIARLILEKGRFGGNVQEIIKAGKFPDFQYAVTLLNCKYEKLGHEDGGWLIDAGAVAAQAYLEELPDPLKSRLKDAVDRHVIECPPKKVFVCEPLAYKKDGVRHEDPKFQSVVHKRIVSYLDSMGIEWELIPACALDLRVKMVMHEVLKK